jgi:predicted aldo/keto reductase-like oxidoreductase
MNSSNPEVLQASYELGVRHFDSAARYQYGRNEQMVGEVIRRLGVRDQVVVATKVLYGGQRAALTHATSKEACLNAVEGSLRRLKMEYVDILYLHSLHSAEELRDPVVPGIMEAMTELKKQGRIRHTGISTHEQMSAVINAAVEDGFFEIILTSFNVTMAGNAPLLAAIKNAADAGIGVVAMKTQAGGGRFPNPAALHRYSSSTVATACLKWVLHNKSIATAIPGYTNFDHMEEDFSVARNLEYTSEERRFLLDQNLELGLGFCQQCGSCLASCVHDTDLPRLMRTHMYAAQYANFHAARSALDAAQEGRGLANCRSCESCTARCAHAVDIPRRIEELKLLYA